MQITWCAPLSSSTFHSLFVIIYSFSLSLLLTSCCFCFIHIWWTRLQSTKQSWNKILKHNLTPFMSFHPIHSLKSSQNANPFSLKPLLSQAMLRSNYQDNYLSSISDKRWIIRRVLIWWISGSDLHINQIHATNALVLVKYQICVQMELFHTHTQT